MFCQTFLYLTQLISLMRVGKLWLKKQKVVHPPPQFLNLLGTLQTAHCVQHIGFIQQGTRDTEQSWNIYTSFGSLALGFYACVSEQASSLAQALTLNPRGFR